MKQQLRRGWLSAILATACTASFAPLAALAAEVPTDVHLKCKGAQDYTGCVRSNKTYLDGPSSSGNTPAPQRRFGFGSRSAGSTDTSAPSNTQTQGGSRFGARGTGPSRIRPGYGNPSRSTGGKSKINLTNEKNITINANETNVNTRKPREAQSGDSRRSNRTEPQNRKATNQENSRRSSKRAERDGSSSRRSASSSSSSGQKRQSRFSR